MRESKSIIYGLRDPRTGEIRYIGQSSFGVTRPKQHYRKALLGEKSYKANWIRALESENLRYEIEILQCCSTSNDLNEAEIRWIACARACGWRLTNATDGGGGTRGLHLPKTLEWRRQISIANSKRVVTDETRAKMSIVKSNPSTETRRRMSVSAKKRSSTAEYKARVSKQHKGLKHTEETKKRISETLRKNAATSKGKAQLETARLARRNKRQCT